MYLLPIWFLGDSDTLSFPEMKGGPTPNRDARFPIGGSRKEWLFRGYIPMESSLAYSRIHEN